VVPIPTRSRPTSPSATHRGTASAYGTSSSRPVAITPAAPATTGPLNRRHAPRVRTAAQSGSSKSNRPVLPAGSGSATSSEGARSAASPGPKAEAESVGGFLRYSDLLRSESWFAVGTAGLAVLGVALAAVVPTAAARIAAVLLAHAPVARQPRRRRRTRRRQPRARRTGLPDRAGRTTAPRRPAPQRPAAGHRPQEAGPSQTWPVRAGRPGRRVASSPAPRTPSRRPVPSFHRARRAPQSAEEQIAFHKQRGQPPVRLPQQLRVRPDEPQPACRARGSAGERGVARRTAEDGEGVARGHTRSIGGDRGRQKSSTTQFAECRKAQPSRLEECGSPGWR